MILCHNLNVPVLPVRANRQEPIRFPASAPLSVILFILLTLVAKSSFALSACYATDSLAQSDYNKIKNECETENGGGGTFYGSIALKSQCVTSDGATLSDLYQLTFGCNTCTSADIKKEVSEFTESCQKKCRTTDYQCSYTNGEWGHSFPLPKVCGAIDSTLSGCGTDESSSSVSEGSSDSGGDGSSSSAGGEGSSSSYGFDGSSSSGGSGETGTSSSGTGTCTGDYCGEGTGDGGGFNLKCCVSTGDEFRSTHAVRYFGDLMAVVHCGDDGSPYAQLNLPVVAYQTLSCCPYSDDGCDYGWDFENCVESRQYFCHRMNTSVSGKGCRADSVFTSVYLEYSSGSFSYRIDLSGSSTDGYVLPSNAPSVEELLNMSVSTRVSDYPVDTVFSSLRDAFSVCQVVSSSSSTESSEMEASSSSNKDTLESEAFIAGENQVYSPEQVFSDGLRNMEIGKCYSLNPDRGIQSGWINDNAQDSWWWVEVPCDGSVPLVETTSAGCREISRGSEAIYLPGECFSGGLDNMEHGKCYALNPDRGIQYGWINNNAQDPWWWVEVPCETETPDSDDEFVCPENGIFFKQNEPLNELDDSIKTFDESVIVLYDALGRKQKSRSGFGKRKALYARKVNRKESEVLNVIFENWSVSFKTVSGFVEAKTELGFKNVHFDCVSQTKTIIVANLYMKTPKDSIDKVVDSDDERLLAHENRHEEIYLLEGNDEWEERISVNSNRLTEKNSCLIVKKTFWPVLERRYRKMLKMQNAWDEEDKNNVSHARINIDSLVALQKTKWNERPCLKENPR